MRSKQKGFTLIELGVTIVFFFVFVIIIGAVGTGIYQAVKHKDDSGISVGVNGIATTRCMDGYKFVVGADGSTRQVMDEYGHGVRCEN